MSDQLQIDLMPAARRTDPATSHEAAALAVGLATRHRTLILGALGLHGAMGKTRIAKVTGLDDVAVARRLPELERIGMVEPTGGRETSASGRPERVWGVSRKVR